MDILIFLKRQCNIITNRSFADVNPKKKNHTGIEFHNFGRAFLASLLTFNTINLEIFIRNIFINHLHKNLVLLIKDRVKTIFLKIVFKLIDGVYEI